MVAQLPDVIPSEVTMKLIINHEPKTKANPIIAEYKIFLPRPIRFELPAEIIIRSPPTAIAITAKGTAIIFTIKL